MLNAAALERETFTRLWEASAGESEEAGCLPRTPHKTFYEEDMAGKTGLEHMPDVSGRCVRERGRTLTGEQFRVLGAAELVPGTVYGVGFTTVCIDTARYLPLLLAQFLRRGGRVKRVFVQHIDQVLLGGWGERVPDGLVVCAGIGARALGGVEDKWVHVCACSVRS